MKNLLITILFLSNTAFADVEFFFNPTEFEKVYKVDRDAGIKAAPLVFDDYFLGSSFSYGANDIYDKYKNTAAETQKSSFVDVWYGSLSYYDRVAIKALVDGAIFTVSHSQSDLIYLDKKANRLVVVVHCETGAFTNWLETPPPTLPDREKCWLLDEDVLAAHLKKIAAALKKGI